MQLTTHAYRRSSKHLNGAVLASARRAYRPAGRVNSADVQTHRQDSKLLLIKEAINFERAQQYSNAQGKSSDFAGFLPRGLQDLQGELPQATLQVRPLAAEAQEYRNWDTSQREVYLRKLLDTLKTFEHLRGGPLQRLGHLQMQNNNKASYGSHTGQDRLFNIKVPLQSQPGNGSLANPSPLRQQPPQSYQPSANGAGFNGHDSTPRSSSPAPWYSRAAQSAPSTAPESLSSSSSAPSHHRSPAVVAAAEMLGLDPSQKGQAGQQGWSYPPPRPPTAGTVDRKVELSDAVKSFLAKPVSGPFRPIYFDLETTDKLHPGARILEVALIGDHSGRTYDTIVNTEGVSSSPGAFAAHHISDNMSWQPSNPIFGKMMSQFLDFVEQECSGPEGGIPVFIAHNGKTFDYKFLEQECKRWNFELPRKWQWMDSLILSRSCVKEEPNQKISRSQQALRERFGIPANNAHRALDDCQVLQKIVPHLLRLNDTPEFSTLMSRKNNKCSGTFEDILGAASSPAHLKKKAAAKEKSTQQITEQLVQDEEDGGFSEPDPLSTSGLAETLSLPKASTAEMQQVRTKWQDGVIDNVKLVRDLLDSRPDSIKHFTGPQQKRMTAAKFDTFWGVLQWYPKHYNLYQTHLRHDSYTLLQGTVTRSYAGGPFLNVYINIQQDHNPLVNDPWDGQGPIQLEPSAQARSKHATDSSDSSASHESSDAEEDSVNGADSALSHDSAEESDLDSLSDSDSGLMGHADGDSDSGLNEHGRSILPEEASTSSASGSVTSELDNALKAPASYNFPGYAPFNGADSQRQPGQQILEIKRFVGAFRGGLAARGLAGKYPPGSHVTVQCKVSESSKPGTWTTNDAVIQHVKPDDPPLAPQLIPCYAARTPIKDKDWPAYIKKALTVVQASSKLKNYDIVPSMLSDQYELVDWLQALKAIHQPKDAADVESGRRRLAFEELLLLQLKLLLRRSIEKSPRSEVDLKGTRVEKLTMMNAGKKHLGFDLTRAQDRVLKEILKDMQGPSPMMRLLQGDVGSGKTAVAVLALLAAAGSGWQGALMAPTEVLAEQHMMKLEKLVSDMPLKHRPRVAILTGSTKAKERRAVYASLADGSTDIIVGTHALITDALEFKKLGLAVIDEQHRFGVNQRSKLQSKNQPLPHVLAMTATPIPRTLALTLHGDMALSAIDEMPPGRKPVLTYAYLDNKSNRKQTNKMVREELDEGGRVFIICPLVEESAKDVMAGIKAAEEEHKQLQQSGVLGEHKCGLLHGRMSADEKLSAMQAFATGETPVLISTTVVEVGVDVPEATIMIVEHADRFGLAQLHQLRGRVGRGLRASTCFLFTPKAKALAKLEVLTLSQNGFTIAEADLKDRGPGDCLGTKQSGRDGLKYLKAAKLPDDRQLLEQARAGAAEMIQEYGLEPDTWPPDLLAAMKDSALPDLDLSEVPQLAWGNQEQKNELMKEGKQKPVPGMQEASASS